MGKSKKNVIISGFTIGCNNRGCDALSIGAISFLKKKNFLHEGDKIIQFRFVKNFFKKLFWKNDREIITIDNEKWEQIIYSVPSYEKWLWNKFHIILPFTKFGRNLRETRCVAAINGGDGFSDIYSEESFEYFNFYSYIAIAKNIPLILLPQTIGPFHLERTENKAKNIIRNSLRVFVRDENYISELNKMGVNYEVTPDLSSYMQPKEWEIDIHDDSIGINVSGLAYSNTYENLSGQFQAYPQLIDSIITFFQKKGYHIYLIPHSYNYDNPEDSNDDLEACSVAYARLENKENVILVDKNLSAPEIKFLISKMKFFIGTRMHANFAAIYTNVPVFGLSYSYKFKGAFDTNGLDGDSQTATINNLTEHDIDSILIKINDFYLKTLK